MKRSAMQDSVGQNLICSFGGWLDIRHTHTALVSLHNLDLTWLVTWDLSELVSVRLSVDTW